MTSNREYMDEAAAMHDPMPGLFLPPDVEPGMLEYDLRTAIKDYARVYGKEAMRDVVAGMVNDEFDRVRPI
jgi:hypothetical protein